MEPQLPMPHQSPEMGPRPLGPEAPRPQTAETYTGAEKREVHEQKAAHMDGDGPGQDANAAQVTPVVPAMPANPAQPVQQTTNDAPAVANDEDLIEKEWVEKAKKVISETKHDPFMQKQAVSRLQADYLNKRYGKSVKLPEEG